MVLAFGLVAKTSSISSMDEVLSREDRPPTQLKAVFEVTKRPKNAIPSRILNYLSLELPKGYLLIFSRSSFKLSLFSNTVEKRPFQGMRALHVYYQGFKERRLSEVSIARNGRCIR